MTTLDIEEPAQLRIYLHQHNHIAAGEEVTITPLAGGVSNRTVLVERPSGEAWVIKQALEKLRVRVDWFSSPQRIHREAAGIRALSALLPPGSVPRPIFEDHEHHLLAMDAVPQPHANWKAMLLAGDLHLDHVEQFARILGTIHRRSHERREQLASSFGDRSFFETLRLEPYYSYTASQHPMAQPFYAALLAETRAQSLALVHGDYSPKNILVHADRLVLLDHEVIHWGDPAFDMGFSFTHLLSKARHVAALRPIFIEGAERYWQIYVDAVGDFSLWDGYEPRAVRHTLACLLARVDGRSPLEYLSADERTRQRALTLALMAEPPATLPQLIQTFAQGL
ncbi:MAG: aminoglycoside phosphotransferase family protein [Caldilineaceae bacterium]|nr:aminoglycoside phosphotransferase family protein [Caldilineaceae bacterium]